MRVHPPSRALYRWGHAAWGDKRALARRSGNKSRTGELRRRPKGSAAGPRGPVTAMQGNSGALDSGRRCTRIGHTRARLDMSYVPSATAVLAARRAPHVAQMTPGLRGVEGAARSYPDDAFFSQRALRPSLMHKTRPVSVKCTLLLSTNTAMPPTLGSGAMCCSGSLYRNPSAQKRSRPA